MTDQIQDLSFLPYLLDEDIYLIDDVIGEVAQNIKSPLIPVAESKSAPVEIQTEPLPEKKPVYEPKPLPPIVAGEPGPTPIKTRKKVVIMVGYQGVTIVPPQVHEALTKIFDALKIGLEEVEIINVLSPNAPKVEDFIFEYLILMGGNGKNLTFMQDYAGSRNRYDIARHNNISILFAESMDVYFKNLELKKKFWGKLKELF